MSDHFEMLFINGLKKKRHLLSPVFFLLELLHPAISLCDSTSDQSIKTVNKGFGILKLYLKIEGT